MLSFPFGTESSPFQETSAFWPKKRPFAPSLDRSSVTAGWSMPNLSGTVEEVGPAVLDFSIGDDVYGVTNAQFCGANAEFAVASAGMVAKKPRSLSYLEAASVPVVAVTAWQMLFEYTHVVAGQSVLILGAGGNVGAYAVQLGAGAGVALV